MNSQTYRIIFNKSRGCVMAVGEHARSVGGGCSGTRKRKRISSHLFKSGLSHAQIESGGAADLKAIVLNNKTTDTRDGFAGLSTDPRVVIVDERSGTQSSLTKAFVDRFGIVKDASATATSNQPGQLPSARLLSDNLVLTAYGKFDFSVMSECPEQFFC